MSESVANALLSMVALLNAGPENDFTMEITALDHCDNLSDSLAQVFSAGTNWRNNTPYSAADWHVRIEKRGDEPGATVVAALKKWIFEMPFRPALEPLQDWIKVELVSRLSKAVTEVVGSSEVYEVFVEPPVFYEASWQDFVFKGTDETWFLHFGVSD